MESGSSMFLFRTNIKKNWKQSCKCTNQDLRKLNVLVKSKNLEIKKLSIISVLEIR